jgi:hypothetical protein
VGVVEGAVRKSWGWFHPFRRCGGVARSPLVWSWYFADTTTRRRTVAYRPLRREPSVRSSAAVVGLVPSPVAVASSALADRPASDRAKSTGEYARMAASQPDPSGESARTVPPRAGGARHGGRRRPHGARPAVQGAALAWARGERPGRHDSRSCTALPGKEAERGEPSGFSIGREPPPPGSRG